MDFMVIADGSRNEFCEVVAMVERLATPKRV